MEAAKRQAAALLEEEQEACDTPLDAKIHKVPVPRETEAEVEEEAKNLYAQFCDVFKCKEDAEYFSMLPLSKKDRMTVLKRASEITKEEKQQQEDWYN